MESTVRVRFAPSPTGPLHIGGVRTALYNFLFAKKNKGKLILRIEDTDQKRLVAGAEEYIIRSLEWAGITFDEGDHTGGPHEPYKQSKRGHLYRKYIDMLIEKGHAYYAFDTAEELEKARAAYQDENKNFQYDTASRMSLKNSLSLPPEKTRTLIESGAPYVVRVLIPANEEVIVNDLIRGEVRVNTSQLDDKVLFKSDGLPTYHLANVVDDHLMQITHVIRGEEWLPSAPLHVLLYKFLGCSDTMPQFAHLPLILKPEGNGKLSKRDGDKHGFPVFPMAWTEPASGETSSGYKESGYFPEAFVNMLALLGWNPGTEQEIFSLDELAAQFSLERVNKSGAKFDPDKTKWFNQQYLRKKDTAELAVLLMKLLKSKDINITEEKALKVCELYKERVVFVHDLAQESSFLYERPLVINEDVARKKCKPNAPDVLTALMSLLQSCENWEGSTLHQIAHDWMTEKQLPAGQVMMPLRLVLAGELKGPEVFDILAVLGKDESLHRINAGIAFFKMLS